MNFSKKYIVVPYIKTIEKTSESMVNNLDKNMSDIITDKELNDDEKMKLYNQALNKLLIKYDPETHGVSPAISKLAQIVSDFVLKEQKENQNLTTNNENKINDPKTENDSFIENLDYKQFTPQRERLNSPVYSKRQLFKEKSPENYYSPETETVLNNYEKNTYPAANLRNLNVATHSEGIDSSINTLKPKKIPKKNIPIQKKPPNSSENNRKDQLEKIELSPSDSKLKNKVEKKLKPRVKESNYGSELWLTKKFF
jgi:hypothetical protein